MLSLTIVDFLDYCKNYNFSKSSLETFSSRLAELDSFLESIDVTCLKNITYNHLSSFVTLNKPSVHIKKARVWTLHQFFHYLKLKGLFKTDIAFKLPYPKIDQKEPECLSPNELFDVIIYFIKKADSPTGIRNLIVVLFLAFLGLRIASVISFNIQDIDLTYSTVRVKEKGDKIRTLPLPQILCSFLYPYLKSLDMDLGPLFQSNRKKRLSNRSIQHLFIKTSKELGLHLHCHLFRHTAATHINRVAGIDVTKKIMGHSQRKNTRRYVHLNQDIYAEYMKRHPFMSLPGKEV